MRLLVTPQEGLGKYSKHRGTCPAGAGYRWSAEEVKETAFRLDGVLLPRDGADEPPVFVEVQFQPKPADSPRQARALYRAAGTERAWILDWVETILVYKLPKLSREEVKMILDLQDVDLKQSRFYQEVFAEGREEGRNEGVGEGRRSEARQLLARQLRRRFGALPADVEARLAALSLERLELLAEDLLAFGGLADLERWLGS